MATAIRSAIAFIVAISSPANRSRERVPNERVPMVLPATTSGWQAYARTPYPATRAVRGSGCSGMASATIRQPSRAAQPQTAAP